MKSRTNTKMSHVGSKTRSLGQILEKSCVCSRDQIFGVILMKLGQSICLEKIFVHSFNPFPNKPWFLRVCCTILLKTLWEKEK